MRGGRPGFIVYQAEKLSYVDDVKISTYVKSVEVEHRLFLLEIDTRKLKPRLSYVVTMVAPDGSMLVFSVKRTA